jgi:hypothetical protein
MSIQVYNNQPSVSAQADSQSKAVETQTPVSAESSAGQKSADASETSEVGEQEASESEADADSDSDEESESVEAKDSEDENAKPKPKKKGGWQRQKEKAEREAMEAKRELEYWRGVALKNGAGEPSKTDTPKADAKQASQDGKPNPDSFESYSEYAEALADWKVDQKLKDRDQKAEQAKLAAEMQKAQQAHFDRVKAFADKTEDFSEVLEAVEDVQVSAAVQELLMSSENGPELMYQLAKNREELERVSKLSPLAAAREIGRLESKLASHASGETKKTETKKQTTQAPAPITPVGSKGGKVTKDITDPGISQREYEAIRKKQMAARQSAW